MESGQILEDELNSGEQSLGSIIKWHLDDTVLNL